MCFRLKLGLNLKVSASLNIQHMCNYTTPCFYVLRLYVVNKCCNVNNIKLLSCFSFFLSVCCHVYAHQFQHVWLSIWSPDGLHRCKGINTRMCAHTDTLSLLNFLLHRNLHGKRPADYAVSVEMLEIFQEASKGTQYADTSLDPSGSFSAVRLHEDVYNLFLFSQES